MSTEMKRCQSWTITGKFNIDGWYTCIDNREQHMDEKKIFFFCKLRNWICKDFSAINKLGRNVVVPGVAPQKKCTICYS